MDKIYIVFGAYDYEGSNVLHVASTQELAEQWVAKYFEYKQPYPDAGDYKQWCSKDTSKWFGSYDDIEIENWTIDEDITNRI